MMDRSAITNTCGSNIAFKRARKHEARPHRVNQKKKKERKTTTTTEFQLDANDFGFICDGVRNVGGYKRNA